MKVYKNFIYVDNMGQTVLSVYISSLNQNLLENIAKFNIDRIICDFDKD